MSKSVKKVMLIGWDGAPPQMVNRMVKKGVLKNFADLMERGTFIYALNPYPTITASNWTVLSTGAWPGIKLGFTHEGMTGIQDVVPTLCYMADIPFPQGREGAIIYDALEDPSFKMKEKSRLERELEKWKDAYEKQVSITHSRF